MYKALNSNKKDPFGYCEWTWSTEKRKCFIMTKSFNNLEFIGKFLGANIYEKENKLLFEFLNKQDLYDFENVIMGLPLDGYMPQPSVSDTLLYFRERRE